MPSTIHRLVSEKDFSRLFRKGRPHHHRLLTVKIAANTLGYPRVGLVVSTKVAKHAVDRNRIKRRLRAILGPLADRLKGGADIAFIAKKEAIGAPFAEMESGVEKLLLKAGVLDQRA